MSNTSPDFTERLLADAGIRAGMHVLDVGCGSGLHTTLRKFASHYEGRLNIFE